MAPHRVRRKHHYVTATDRNINDRRTIRQLVCTREHATDEQVLLVRHKTQHDARAQLRRSVERTLARVLIGIGPIVWIRRTRLRHCLDHVGIVNTTASRSTRSSTAALSAASTTAKSATATSRNLKQRRLAEIKRQAGVVTISDRALAIGERAVVNRAARLKFVGRLNRNAAGDAVVDRNA